MDSVKTTYTRDNLFAGLYPEIYDAMTIASGQTLSRGAVLGKITTGGQGKLLAVGSSDGSQNFYAILTQDVDTTGGAKVAPIAIAGSFQSQALSFGASTDVDDVKEAARALNCYIKTSVADNNVVGG